MKRRYDLVLVDCPPSLGLLTVNALVAADHALISSEAEYFSLQGVEQALEVVELAKESLHPDLDWLGVVLNIADLRLVHSREALEQLQERFGDKVFETVIRRSFRYAESAERGVSILDYAPGPGRRLPGTRGRGAGPAGRLRGGALAVDGSIQVDGDRLLLVSHTPYAQLHRNWGQELIESRACAWPSADVVESLLRLSPRARAPQEDSTESSTPEKRVGPTCSQPFDADEAVDQARTSELVKEGR